MLLTALPLRNLRWAIAALATGLMIFVVAAADIADTLPVDTVTAGDEPGEREHQMKGEHTSTQQLNGRAARVAETNGWFSWELRVVPDVVQDLNVEWKPVTHPSPPGCEGDRYNRMTFDPVETDGLRLDVELPERFSSGLLQWKVE